jgi:predicted dehydrogenase
MKQVVQNYRTGELRVIEAPVPAVKRGFVLVRNVNSFISVGTEKLMIDLARKSLIGKAMARPDLVKRVMDKVRTEGIVEAYRQAMNRLDDLVPLGYSCAGDVVEVGAGVKEFKVGDRVACFGSGFASHAEYVAVPKNLCAKIPEGVDYESASLAAIGAIALHGVRLANLTLGERVVVIGLGLLGQITVQILKAQGCKVFGVDIDEEKVALAKEHGLDEGIITAQDVKSAVENFTRGVGADAVIITASTKSNEPIELASEIAREKARIVAVGLVGLNIPRKIFFEKELDFVVSRGAGPGIFDENFEVRGNDYPLPYVRWTEQRNMEAFLELVAQGKVRLDKIITHRYDINDALKAYDMILGKTKEKYIGIVLSYGEGEKKIERKVIVAKRVEKSPKGKVNVGLIGAGLFARTTLLPLISKMQDVVLKGVSTATGASGRHAAEKFGFEYCTTNYEEILNDESIDAVIIATRHNLHAKLVIEAMKRGKDVFVEKPLAISEEELRNIRSAWREAQARVMVGFNRRFSSLSVEAKKLFGDAPLVINYRVNAGYIEKEHWVHGEQGGGRIIGEVCHFVDLIQYFTDAYPVKVYAEAISGNTGKYLSEDNVAINIKMSDGSVGNIVYVASGDKAFPRERIEIFGNGAVCVIDNFRQLYYTKDGKSKKKRTFGISWGYKEEFETFFRAIKEGRELPVDFEGYVYTTLATIRMVESLKEGRALEVNIDALI